jgi:UDP-galactopyranose mutase
MIYDYLIVGAGFSGAVIAERLANCLDKKILVIDKRSHIGGNCYDFSDDNGILIHKYGPHAFHTTSEKVRDYLSGFTDWIPYEHKVLAVIEGIKVPIPFNFNSIDMLFPTKQAKEIQKQLLERYPKGLNIPIIKLLEVNVPLLKQLAEFIYEKVFYGYTVKQWGLQPTELDYTVMSRVPVSLSRDDRYFRDSFQAMPKLGYTKIFENMLAHKNIEVALNTDFFKVKDSIKYKNLIYTGAIDEYFDYMYGALPYRSLSFEFETRNEQYFQETAQVNYPNEHEYTRITEFKHFYHNNSARTIIAREFPEQYVQTRNEPYYPIPQQKNHELFTKYVQEAKKIEPNTLFIGRLAGYKYYNMTEVIAVALLAFEKIAKMS